MQIVIGVGREPEVVGLKVKMTLQFICIIFKNDFLIVIITLSSDRSSFHFKNVNQFCLYPYTHTPIELPDVPF